jgi:molybdopterin synthase sulfur carrier subunit
MPVFGCLHVSSAKPMLTVHVRYFASLREALGPEERVTLPVGSTVGGLRALLHARGGRHAEVLAPGRPVRAALRQAVCADDAVLADGDEVAFFPPVTGG